MLSEAEAVLEHSLANSFELNALLTPNSFLQVLVSALALEIHLH